MTERLHPLTADFDGAVTGLFTTRAGGFSTGPWSSLNLACHVSDSPEHVAANRGVLQASLGHRPMHFAEQVHGAGVAVVGPDMAGTTRWTTRGAPGADALVTAMPGVPLVVLAADCLPILLADMHAGVVGAVHAGRLGLVAGVLQRTLDTMIGLGASPEHLVAVIGPAVCGRCYEVPAQMRDEVAAVVPDSAVTTGRGTPGLDLPAAAQRLLRSAGVASVSRLQVCTVEDVSVFSHRRSGGQATGRHAGVVMLDA